MGVDLLTLLNDQEDGKDEVDGAREMGDGEDEAAFDDGRDSGKLPVKMWSNEAMSHDGGGPDHVEIFDTIPS
jgi:hypothetical protein